MCGNNNNSNRYTRKTKPEAIWYLIKHGVIEMAIQSSNILPHFMPLGNFIQYCSLRVSLFVLGFG